MGLCGAKMTAEQKAEMKRSKELERQNRADHEEEASKVKLLLLGAGESGKSTIFKQLRIIYGVGYSEADLKLKTPVIYNNTIAGMKTLIEACDLLEIAMSDETKELGEQFEDIPDDAIVNEELGEMVRRLWEDESIKEAFTRRSEFQLPDCAEYYFDNVERIAASDYQPTVDDVLRSRVRTSGIITEQYEVKGHIFEVYDVGGQRNERRKWIHCFDDVTAIIFVAALSEYDQVLYEDNTENRMVEAVNLFDEICNSPLFAETSMLLFLNKDDLFRRKIETVDINQPPTAERPGYFTDYDGGCNYEAGLNYLLNTFLSRNRSPQKQIFHHVTTATDTKIMSYVMNDCRQIILQENLENSGFMV